MKIKNIIKTLSFASLMICFGCEGFLDQIPDNRTELEDAETLESLLVTAYPTASHILMSEFMSDNSTDLGPTYSTFFIWTENLYNWEPVIEDDQDSPSFYWSSCYEAIAAANHVLAKIEELGTDEELDPIKGEALMCRAYSHFMLVNIFAQHYNPTTADTDLGIPYATEPETTIFNDYERKSVAEVYELVQEDLELGLELISNDLYEVPKYHFNSQAAYAFASRFYLFKGDWEKCIEYSDKVVGDAPESILRNWQAYDEMSINEIFELYTRSTETTNLLMIGAPSLWARIVMADRYGTTEELTSDFYNYSNGVHPWGGGEENDGRAVNTGTYAMRNLYNAGADLWFTIKWEEKFQYAYPGASYGIPYIFQPVFTSEEVLLNRAEAYIMAGKSAEGIADMNTWVNSRCPNGGSIPEYLEEYFTLKPHADLNPWFTMTDEQDQLIKAVLEIRRKEFLDEGLRWFDIKRYNFEISHEIFGGNIITLPPDDIRRAIQIPQEATNNGIEPNPVSPSTIGENDLVKVINN